MSTIRCRACGAHLATISARLLELPQHPSILTGIITDHQAYCGLHCHACGQKIAETTDLDPALAAAVHHNHRRYCTEGNPT